MGAFATKYAKAQKIVLFAYDNVQMWEVLFLLNFLKHFCDLEYC